MIYFINRFFAPDESATAQMLTQLVAALSEQNLPATVLTSRMRHDDPSVSLPRAERLHGAQVHRLWSTRFGRAKLSGRALDYLSFYLSAWFAVWRLRRGDVLVALTDPPMIGNVLQAVARLRGARVVHWLQDVFPEVAQALLPLARKSRFAALLLAWRNRSLRRADALVVLGSRMAEHVQACGVLPERVHQIANWADERVLSPLPREENPLRKEWGLEANFVVGYSGNLGRAHEFETLVQAMLATSDIAHLRFLFIGQGAQWAALQARVREFGLSERVMFRGFQPSSMLRFSLSVPDVHVVTLQAELEGLIVPSKLYGAMAVGRPIAFIGDADGEVARTLRAHGCGTSVQVNQVQALADAFRRYASEPEALLREGQSAYAAFTQGFSCKLAVARWSALLRTLQDVR